MYVIRNEDDDQLFWSNEFGWVEAGSEDFYTQEERDTLNLPHQGVWAYDCPQTT
jgi:hypothetical protein